MTSNNVIQLVPVGLSPGEQEGDYNQYKNQLQQADENGKHTTVSLMPMSLSTPMPHTPVNPAVDPTLLHSFPGGIVRYWTDPTVAVPTSPSLWQTCVDHVVGVRCREHWMKSLQPELFLEPAIWKAALVELLGTFLLMFIALVTVCSILNHTEDYSYFPTAIAILHIPIISFMIFATATTTGGHLNPMISFATMLAGLTEMPRAVLYIIAQMLASIMAAYTVKSFIPASQLSVSMLGMCSIGTEQSPSQALTLELFCDLFVLFIAFGVALDDKQRQAFPPWLAPLIIGTVIALFIYTTGQFSPFGTGAIAYPNRCFGPAVAMGLLTADSFTLGNGVTVRNAQWIYWVGPFISSFITAFFYRLVPPGPTVFITQTRKAKQETQTQPVDKDDQKV